MMKFYKTIPLLLVAALFASCDDDTPKEPTEPQEPTEQTAAERTVLVYAVADNILKDDLVDDKKEMLAAVPSIDGLGNNVRVLVYEMPYPAADHCTLSELKKDEYGKWDFCEIKTYDRNTYSTDPKRMSEVFSDVAAVSPAENYGLIFWSHGTGWIPKFADHEVNAPTARGPQKSFGYDNYNGKTDYCDINELADALPDGMFDFVWFDCCYMMCVETAYELRDKCDYVCGYPTEDWDTGMNYDATLPLLARKDPDLVGAAKAFYDFYEAMNLAATVTVSSTEGLEALADVTRRIYAAGTAPSYVGLQNYSRLGYGLYDFGQYTRLYLKDAEDADALLAEFDEALGNVVKYGACSSFDFERRPLDPGVYSGFSCHYPGLKTSAAQNSFYDSLAWPQAVY